MDQISTLIATIGFPIVACCGLGYFVRDTVKGQREDSREREEKLMDQLSKSNEVMFKFNETLISIDSRVQSIENTVNHKEICTK